MEYSEIEKFIIESLLGWNFEISDFIDRWNRHPDNKDNKIDDLNDKEYTDKIHDIAQKKEELSDLNERKETHTRYIAEDLERKTNERKSNAERLVSLNAEIRRFEEQEAGYRTVINDNNAEKARLERIRSDVTEYEGMLVLSASRLHEFVETKNVIKKQVIPNIKAHSLKWSGMPEDTEGFLALKNSSDEKDRKKYASYAKRINEEIYNGVMDHGFKERDYTIKPYGSQYDARIMDFDMYISTYEEYEEKGLAITDDAKAELLVYKDRIKKREDELKLNKNQIDALIATSNVSQERANIVEAEKAKRIKDRDALNNRNKVLDAEIADLNKPFKDWNARIDTLDKEIKKFDADNAILAEQIIPAAKAEREERLRREAERERQDRIRRKNERYVAKDQSFNTNMYLGNDKLVSDLEKYKGDIMPHVVTKADEARENGYEMINQITHTQLKADSSPEEIISAMDKIHINGLSATAYYQLEDIADADELRNKASEINRKLSDALDYKNLLDPQPEKNSELTGQIISVENKYMMLEPVFMAENEVPEPPKKWWQISVPNPALDKVKEYNRNVKSMCSDFNAVRKEAIVHAEDVISLNTSEKLQGVSAETRRQISLYDALRASKGLKPWQDSVEREEAKNHRVKPHTPETKPKEKSAMDRQ